MSQLTAHQAMVGNEFVLPRPRFSMSDTLTSTDSEPLLSAVPLYDVPEEFSTPEQTLAPAVHAAGSILRVVGAFGSKYIWTILVLILSACLVLGIEIAAQYKTDKINHAAAVSMKASETAMIKATAGLDMMVPSSQVQSKLSAIASQPVVLSVGTHQVSVTPTTIKSWIQVTPNPDKAESYLHINTSSIINSLQTIAKGFVVSPVNQVSVTHNDGITPSGIILAGKNGTGLSNPATIATQAKQLSRSVMNGTGLQFSTPLTTVPFQAATPASFNKLLEVDVTTKRMYAYQNGQLVRTFLVSAGKPSTPTPLGIFHIWDKTPDQTMVGPGYVQPNVHWINYFDHNGDAVHGNYWRPASVFGNVNTSHGCVGIPDDQAEWVYDWAPIGTTVINYN